MKVATLSSNNSTGETRSIEGGHGFLSSKMHLVPPAICLSPHRNEVIMDICGRALLAL